MAAHRGKLRTRWLPSDFTIHDKPHWEPISSVSPIMDEEDAVAADKLEMARLAVQRVRAAYSLALGYKGNLELAFHVMGIALGWDDIVGCKTDVQLARKLKLGHDGKATVGKCKKEFQKKIRMKPLIGQRTESACDHMRSARVKQLARETPNDRTERRGTATVENQKPV